MRLSQFYGLIGAPGINDQHFRRTFLGIFHDVDDIVFFIFVKINIAKELMGSAPSLSIFMSDTHS